MSRGVIATLVVAPVLAAPAVAAYPSVDYGRWRVVPTLEGAERGTWSPDGSKS
jgi:hypothetical protein